VVWDGQKGDLFDQMDYPEVMRRRDLKEAAMMTCDRLEWRKSIDPTSPNDPS